MRVLEHRIPPPALAVAFAGAMWGLAKLAPGLQVSLALRLALAVPVALIGACFAVAGILSFRSAKTTINPLKPETASSLVNSGIYRVTRNPMYVGLASMLLAWAIFLASPLALAVVVGYVWYIDRLQIRPEERALAALFGADYERYKAKVRRWL